MRDLGGLKGQGGTGTRGTHSYLNAEDRRPVFRSSHWAGGGDVNGNGAHRLKRKSREAAKSRRTKKNVAKSEEVSRSATSDQKA